MIGERRGTNGMDWLEWGRGLIIGMNGVGWDGWMDGWGWLHTYRFGAVNNILVYVSSPL